MIELNNVCIKIDKKEIIKDISLMVSKGEKVVIYGKSGSGKTSLFKSMVGILKIDKGTIFINSLVLNDKNISKIHKHICYIPQTISAFCEEIVWDFIYFPFSFKSNRALNPDKKEILALFSRLSLDKDLLTHKICSLSGGERQRIAILRGVLLKRDIFLLDEITSSIDKETSENIVSFFMKNKNITVISISHEKKWKALADTYYQMINGQLIKEKVYDK